MKTLLILSFCLFALTGFAAKYTYNSYPITKRTYNKLFRRFKAKLFVLSDGKVISPLDTSGKPKKMNFYEGEVDGGDIAGKVLKIINKNIFTLKVTENEIQVRYSRNYNDRISGKKGTRIETKIPHYYTVAICGGDTSSFFAGDAFTASVIPTGAYVDKLSGQRMRKFDVLKPITAAEFRKYLDDGNKLYTYHKRLTGHTPCEKCQGRGHLPNPKNQRRKKGRMAAPDLDCPDCKYGKIPVYKYTKIAIKPRKKKIASR